MIADPGSCMVNTTTSSGADGQSQDENKKSMMPDPASKSFDLNVKVNMIMIIKQWWEGSSQCL